MLVLAVNARNWRHKGPDYCLPRFHRVILRLSILAARGGSCGSYGVGNASGSENYEEMHAFFGANLLSISYCWFYTAYDQESASKQSKIRKWSKGEKMI